MVHRSCKRTQVHVERSRPATGRHSSVSTLAQPLDGKVIEYIPERRIGWYSFGTFTEHGPLCVSYHTWLLTPIGAKKCHVIFEEVATGRAALYAREAYPEIVHVSHLRWLEQLKKVSEASSKHLSSENR
jgi:hypothetical protein